MAASTTTIFTKYQDGEIMEYPVYRNTMIPAGALVMLRSDGYAINGADTTGCTFVGVAAEEADNSSGSDGTINIQVRRKGVFRFLLGSAAITDIGVDANCLYNNEVARDATTTYDITCGKVVGIDGSTHAWVDIDMR